MYQQIRSVVEPDFLAVDKFIVSQLHSNVPLVENIGHYIVDAGGKRLRPILVLLAARCCNVNNEQHIPLAAVIEFIHTATLLHDDVVDMSALRRGRPTVNAQWNNPSSVLVGDFIYSRAFQILVNIGDMSIMEIIADTTNKIAEGEVLQLLTKNNPDSSEQNYRQVIQHKTAILFQAAAQCGAMLTDATQEQTNALKQFGMHLGTAFQLIDDVLDYDGDSESLGKNIGDDLAEGKPTLPLIHALKHADKADADLIRKSLTDEQPPTEALSQIIEIVRDCGSLTYARDLAESESKQALSSLSVLPPSQYRDALELMVQFSLNRNH
ncbi:MAG: octaprenyl diphosphate synthase [SAR86 cluster bacterium]|uniref:Octaprenyl diphosphate synthase n=1 Tax=SAR86 cluster bacterium TaxID=2030880 RepID=A0A2A5B2W7_9GAMM|nr:MAG: octaprenyl diphosphate synthase [SAR86 cluster bacterium]